MEVRLIQPNNTVLSWKKLKVIFEYKCKQVFFENSKIKMYNSHFICTYHFYDESLRELLPENEVTENILENVENNYDFADILYKAELLQVFGLNDIDEMDDLKIVEEMEALYKKISGDETFAKCALLSANKVFTEDPVTGFMMMFNYHTFFVTHRCLCEFIEKGELSQENRNLLMKNHE